LFQLLAVQACFIYRASKGSAGEEENEVLFAYRASEGSEGEEENEVLFAYRASIYGFESEDEDSSSSL